MTEFEVKIPSTFVENNGVLYLRIPPIAREWLEVTPESKATMMMEQKKKGKFISFWKVEK